MQSRLFTLSAIGALVASMAIVGCNKQEQADANSTASDSVAKVEQKALELGNDASKGIDKAKDATRDIAKDAKEAGQNASDKVGNKVADAVITTTVKAELAKDSNLSAMKINVDTEAGRVALHGTAPSTAAREHATALAQGVKGVVSVDNQLSVEPGKT
jgi:hyperosmotically inducible periplasmic protein